MVTHDVLAKVTACKWWPGSVAERDRKYMNMCLAYQYPTSPWKVVLVVTCMESNPSLVPRPCARLSLAVQNSLRGPGLVHHVMSATVYFTAISLKINDVIGWASAAFHVERGSQRSQWRFVCKLS